MPSTPFRRPLLAAGCVFAVALALGAARPTGAPAHPTSHVAAAETIALAPVADTYVRADSRKARLGSSPRLSAQGGRRARRAYLRFEVNLPPGVAVRRAKLRLYTLSKDRGAGVALRGSGQNLWSDSALTWRTQPNMGAVVDRKRFYRRHAWISLNATPIARRGGSVTLALTTTGRSWHGFGSREARRGRPKLVITTAAAERLPAPAPPTQAVTAANRWYSPASPWNTVIPASPPIHPDSAAMVDAFPDGVIGPTNSSVPSIWIGNASTPKVDVVRNYPTCGAAHYQVPIPAAAQVENANESKFVLLESDTGVEWDFFKMTSPGVTPLSSGADCPATSSWAATVVQRHDPGWTGDGLGYSVRGSQTFEGAGTIRRLDTEMPPGSTWDHALALAYPLTSANDAHPCSVWPAQSCDGTHTGRTAIPEGARIQLDPAVDCSTWPSLGGREWQRQLCRTLQRFGMIVVDTGGALINEFSGSYDIHPAGYSWPWEADGWPNLPSDLLPHLRVLDWTKWTGR